MIKWNIRKKYIGCEQELKEKMDILEYYISIVLDFPEKSDLIFKNILSIRESLR